MLDRRHRGLIDGTISVQINENTGKVLLIDEAAAVSGGQAVTELPLSAEGVAPRTDVPVDQTLFSLSEDATGVRSGVLSTVGRIPGTKVNESERAVSHARSRLKQFENDLARSLVHNPRFPVAERQAVLEAMDLSPAMFDTPSALRVRMRAASQSLTTRLAQFERDAADPSLDQDTRAAQQSNAAVIANALESLGVPDGTIGEDLTPQSISSMSPVQVNEIVSNLSEEEIDALPDEVKSSLVGKLR